MTKRIIAIISILVVCVFVALPASAADGNIVKWDYGSFRNTQNYLSSPSGTGITGTVVTTLFTTDCLDFTSDIYNCQWRSTTLKNQVYVNALAQEIVRPPLGGGFFEFDYNYDGLFYYLSDGSPANADYVRSYCEYFTVFLFLQAYDSANNMLGTVQLQTTVHGDDASGRLIVGRTYHCKIEVSRISSYQDVQYYVLTSIAIHTDINFWDFSGVSLSVLNGGKSSLNYRISNFRYYDYGVYKPGQDTNRDPDTQQFLDDQQALDDAMGSVFDGSGGQAAVDDLKSVEGQVNGLIDTDRINAAFNVSANYNTIKGGVMVASQFLQFMYDKIGFYNLVIPLAICIGAVGLLLGLVKNR